MVEFVNGPESRILRRLGRIDGVVNERVVNSTENGAAIDFTLGFPKNPLVVGSVRTGGIANSSISIDSNGEVDTFTYRLPPVPANLWQHGGVRDFTKDIVSRYEGGEKYEVQVNPGNNAGDVEEWWPHILFLSFLTIEPSEALDFLENVLSDWMKEAREETERLRSKY